MTATVKEALTEWTKPLKALFGKQKDNKMFQDMGIEKGFMTQFRYALFMFFVLPFRIFAYILSPKWEWLHFLAKNIITPALEINAVSGDESPAKMLSKAYEKNLNYLATAKKSGVENTALKPEIDNIERIMLFAKVRVVGVLLIFAGVAVEIAEFAQDGIASDAGVGLLISLFAIIGMSGEGLVLVFIPLIYYTILSILLSYLFIFAYRFVVMSFKQIIETDTDMIRDFIDDSMNYTILKARELYGDDVAFEAYELLLENFISKNNHKIEMEHKHYLDMIKYNRSVNCEINDVDFLDYETNMARL